MKVGVNGFGRIGKLSVWHHIERKFFDEIVVNVGRGIGTSFEDLVHYLENDSTYGPIHKYLYGSRSKPVIDKIDVIKKRVIVDGVSVKFLTESRNPSEVEWNKNFVKIVVDTTGKFLDPTLPSDYNGGSLKGYFKRGVKKIIVSAPFKIKKNLEGSMPSYAITTVMGINGNDYNPKVHKLISNASCTTTCLAHMIKPLINKIGAKRILSASMATVHASTGSQQVLDRLPQRETTDLRKNRSVLNNIILTSTGAARALNLVIPEMKNVGFIAESVRIPITTGSLIILVLNIQENPYSKPINRKTINNIYKDKAKIDNCGYLRYSEKQNVSCDVIGLVGVGAIIEGHETHTRTAEINIDLSNVPDIKEASFDLLQKNNLKIPITQAVIYGWYDNEMGGYVSLLGDRTVSIASGID